MVNIYRSYSQYVAINKILNIPILYIACITCAWYGEPSAVRKKALSAADCACWRPRVPLHCITPTSYTAPLPTRAITTIMVRTHLYSFLYTTKLCDNRNRNDRKLDVGAMKQHAVYETLQLWLSYNFLYFLILWRHRQKDHTCTCHVTQKSIFALSKISQRRATLQSFTATASEGTGRWHYYVI